MGNVFQFPTRYAPLDDLNNHWCVGKLRVKTKKLKLNKNIYIFTWFWYYSVIFSEVNAKASLKHT